LSFDRGGVIATGEPALADAAEDRLASEDLERAQLDR